MNLSPEGRPTSGEELARRSKESPAVLPLTDSRVQVYLARLAFPGDAEAMLKWVEGEEDSLSSKFRAFVEDAAHTPAGSEINVQDSVAVAALLEGVQKHAPERTVH